MLNSLFEHHYCLTDPGSGVLQWLQPGAAGPAFQPGLVLQQRSGRHQHGGAAARTICRLRCVRLEIFSHAGKPCKQHILGRLRPVAAPRLLSLRLGSDCVHVPNNDDASNQNMCLQHDARWSSCPKCIVSLRCSGSVQAYS